MNCYKLKIISKNKESLMYFYNFLFCENKKLQKNFFTIKKHHKSFNKTKKLTILKAPHVYKVAQEQFKTVNYSEIYLISTTNYIKFLKSVKYVKMSKISDVNFVLQKISFKNKLNFNNSVTLTNIMLYFFGKRVNYLLKFKKSIKLIFNLNLINEYLMQTEVLSECKTINKTMFR